MSVKIEIEKRDHVEVTRERNPENSWDNDDIAHNYTIEGYRVVGEKVYWDFILEEDPKGKTLYFVYALYDTGDSFHREDNKICELGLYEHEDDAQAVMSALEKDYKSNPHFDFGNPNLIKVALPNRGKIEEISTSTWKGYFERLREIVVEPVSNVGKRRVRFQ